MRNHKIILKPNTYPLLRCKLKNERKKKKMKELRWDEKIVKI
jgi:hypothetical protein